MVPSSVNNLLSPNGNDSRSLSNSASLDLNKDPVPSEATNHAPNGLDESISSEIRQTVAIGTEIGFQMEADNHILAEVVGGLGVIAPNQ